ncbi:MAG: FtsX-like permease family protein [Syntrophobacter sp.]
MNPYVVLAWKNIRRFRTRSALTIFAVACSVGVLFSILSFHLGFEKNLEKEIEKTGLDFMVVSKGCSFEVASLVLYGAVLPKYLDDGLLVKVREPEGVEFATPILVGQAPNLKSGRVDVVYGMDMADIATAKPEWVIEGTAPKHFNEVLMGYLLAEQYKLKVGDEVNYFQEGSNFRVTGVLKRLNSQEDSAMFMPIHALQKILGKPGAMTSIGVKARHFMMIESIRDDLTLKIPGVQIITMGQVRENISGVVASSRALTLTIAIVVAMVSVIGVVNSMLISVFASKREIGVMRAIGASRQDIFLWTLYESVVILGLGGITGILLGIAGSGLAESMVRKIIPYVPMGDTIHSEPRLALSIFLSSLLIGVLSGLYPAWKSSRVRPIEVINC